MNSLSFCYLLFAFTLTEIGHGLSTKKQVTFPLKSIDNKDHDFQQLRIAFQDMVDSSDLFVQTSPLQKRNNVCSVPALGSDVMVKFQANDKNNEIENSAFHDDHSNESLMPSEFVLSVEASGKDDFGWICVKFYDNKELFQDIVDISGLHEAVIDHFNKQPPHPGFDANSAKLAGSREIQDLFENPQSAMGELEKNGFLILSNGPKSTQIGHEKLTQYLVEKTNQAKHVRTDKVHFLSRDQASYCGFEEVRQDKSSPDRSLHPRDGVFSYQFFFQ